MTIADSRMPIQLRTPSSTMAPLAPTTIQLSSAGISPARYWKPDTAEIAPVRKYEMQMKMPPRQPMLSPNASPATDTTPPPSG